MAHTREGLISAALVLAAVTAIGCSEKEKPREARSQAPPRAVPTSFIDSSAPAEAVVPVPQGPVSFADAETAYTSRNYTEASRLFAVYTEQHPSNAWGHFMHGLSAWKGGDLGVAETAFEEALRLDPDHVKSLVNLSRVLLDGNRPEAALERLARVGELEPDSNVVHRLLGRAYAAQGKVDEAIDAYRRAIELDGEDGWAMNNLGLLFLEQGRAEDALPLLSRAAELGKDVALFHNNLGMALEHTGRFKAAAEAYSGALAADAGYEKARLNLARVEQVKEAPQEPADPDAAAKGIGAGAQASVEEAAAEP